MGADSIALWRDIKSIAADALEQPESEREGWVRNACSGDPAKSSAVLKLLDFAEVLDEPAPTPTGRFSGQKIGPYQIHWLLGAGGMGEVYLATRTDHVRMRVAIKFLRPDCAHPGLVRRFRGEAQILAALDHPNIVKLLDAGETRDNQPYFVMSYVEGSPINAWCAEHQATLSQRLQLFRKICQAVQYAHDSLLIHRDLKPSNVLVTVDGTVKLMDFGVAKLLRPELMGKMEADIPTASWERPMTPAYASPEQLRGGPITTSADVYSLGVILYELLTGTVPFSPKATASWEEFVRLVQTEGAPRPSWSGKDVSASPPRGILPRQLKGDLDNIVIKCLQKAPEGRYRTPQELAEDIERYQQGLPVRAHPNSLAQRMAKNAWKVAALVALGAIGVGAYEYHSSSASPKNGRALLYAAEFTNSTGDTSFDDVLRDIVAQELNRSDAVQVVASSEEDLVELLQKAGKGPDDSLTSELARRLCQPAKGQFFTEGEIKPQGDGYMLELSVRGCNSVAIVAQQRGTARKRDDVMRAASQLAAAIRVQLSGDSANSSDNTPAPLPTASLGAYRAYLLGEKLYETQLKQSAAILRRATELDPSFAKAWDTLSLADYSLGDQKRDDEDLKHAFDFRTKLPDNERATVEARYHWEITGEIYKAIEDLQTLESLQPNEFGPHNLLALVYSDLGMYEKAITEFRKNVDLFSNNAHAIDNLSVALIAQGRYDEAEAMLGRISWDQIVGFHEHATRYQLAMLRADQATLKTERTWMEQNSDEPLVISLLARIDLCEGRLESARQRTQHAVNVSVQSGLSESAAHMLLNLAWGETLYGQNFAARQTLVEAMKLSDSKETKEGAIRVMVLNDQQREAQKMLSDLLHEYPTDTIFSELDAPLVLAASQLGSGQASDALRTLDRAKPFQFGRRDGLLSNYMRAFAYLRLRRPEDAIGEFSAILTHRGLSPLSPILVSSQLGLARAYALQGDIAKSHAARKLFFAGWKDADSDLAILKKAKAE